MPGTIGGELSFCGRELTAAEKALIQEVTRECHHLPLTELAFTVCELLEWRRPNGGLKTRECYLFLQTCRARGWLPWLPAPRARLRRPHLTRIEAQSDPQPPLTGALQNHLPVELELIDRGDQRRLFQQYIDRYHYLGYRVPYGAQLRYFVRCAPLPSPLLACLLFTSAAWKMAPRDAAIGWTQAARQTNLTRVIANSRFLILPWVRIPNLASHILSLAAQRLPRDWAAHYRVEPLLLETLVDRERYSGVCYRAANWMDVGQTQGRGRMDGSRQAQGSRKQIFLYPLHRRWREWLCQAPGTGGATSP
jgi:Domain of unknown function (DUF4338)